MWRQLASEIDRTRSSEEEASVTDHQLADLRRPALS